WGELRGAIATSYSHDSHNLVVLGRDANDMALAAAIRRRRKSPCLKAGVSCAAPSPPATPTTRIIWWCSGATLMIWRWRP
ncbi:hypothetical protein G7B21_29150, partial [Klebsiella pneumoniae]|nr:hypothetical protein [Klebsiella pneumoniae]